jgi:hypothetical protein
MATSLEQYTADHRRLLEAAGRQAGFSDPVAVELDEFETPLLMAARRGPPLPVDGVLVRDWDPAMRSASHGLRIGMRIYEIDSIRFVRVSFLPDSDVNCAGFDFTAVDRKDYRRLYRIALHRRLDQQSAGEPPVLPQAQLDVLWKNTVGYLDGDNLARVKAYGGRARRGVLLTGAPGNGKTMACRWVLEECRRRCWEYHLVTPDAYRAARKNEVVEKLFGVGRRGVVFFDDMDLALRDRDTIAETEDQAVFLSALDGLKVQEGVVFVFTTNCPLDLIDRAFKRPGRIDLALHFQAPDAALRRRLLGRWHAEIRAGLDVDRAVASTDGYSFAEIEELKNLLVLHFMDAGAWDWDWALRQFAENRGDLHARQGPRVGFAAANGRRAPVGFRREQSE